MTIDAGVHAPPDWNESAARLWWRWPVLPALLAVVIGAVWLTVLLRPQPPGDESADAGFARDMSRHHGQAVGMASIIYERTQDPKIRILAYDILTTQQGQIGAMSGWLSVWGLLSGGSEPPMAWMGHPVEGPMPGMAPREEEELLRTLPSAEADAEFLRLMVRHHQGGVLMAEAGLARADRATVRSLAWGIVGSQ